jgi:hypothetical protein
MLLLSLTIEGAFASDERHSLISSWNIPGRAVMGPNDVCGSPQWKLPTFGLLHATLLGEFNPEKGATDAIKISLANCDSDTLLATTKDVGFESFLGIPDPDQRLLNKPLRKVSSIAGFDGVRGEVLPFSSLSRNPFPATRNSSVKPIRLGDWLKASGSLKIDCHRNVFYADIGIIPIMPPPGLCRAECLNPRFGAVCGIDLRHN